MSHPISDQNITLDKAVVVIVSAYAALQLLFSFANLPTTPLYVLPVSLVPAFFLIHICSGQQIEYERFSLLLVLSVVLIFAATFSRQPYPDAYDHAKYLLLYFFYFMGVNGHLNNSFRVLRQARFLLYALPMILLSFYLFVLGGSGNFGGSVAFLANRNNLSGLIIAIVLTISVINPGHRLVYLLLPVLILVGTLGGVLALAIALITGYGLRPRYLIAAVAFVSLIGYAALTLDWSFAVRINNAFIILATMWELNFLDALDTMTFSDAAGLVSNASDTSIFFRLKQWLEIVIVMASNWGQLIYGFGFSASEVLTTSQKLPHNDWLRVLFEGGVFSLATFGLLTLVALRDLYRYDLQSFIVGLGLFVFMLSDNLIDNFLLSFLLFYSLGLVRQAVHRRPSSTEELEETESSADSEATA